MKRLVLVFTLMVSACVATVPLPDGFRMNRYKAPVPDRVPGGQVLSVEQAQAMHEKGQAVFIDVISANGFLTDGIDGDWLTIRPRRSIPNSQWLPDVGRGALTPKQKAYFKQGLETFSKGDQQQPLVFFCLKDCWMSWNAVKRASLLGYGKVYWFPAGTEGWAENGYKLVPIRPHPHKS
ncbi:rhodanese-like domain-containing protein [Terasakiella sp. SH-1]|uniref:rhodanese-like domain-containing protein n=1 Tax=Terasakiella sp. SH-1 TaxID=2560057 RepID=UPI001073F83F|nr:rhodanese-like domain-containing protein [Terasakiella sp. SH-1]